LPFDEARRVARGLGFGLQAEYYAAARAGLLPKGLPKDPQAAYRSSGWQDWGDWLGTSRQSTLKKRQKRRPFPEVVDFARSLGLKGKADWFRWAKSGERPDDIPVNPSDSYKGDGWQSWPHFLGTTKKKAGEIVYREFHEAREWARSQGLQTKDEWKAQSGRLPQDVPANPWHVYRHRGWINIGDWLGKGQHHSKNRQWRPLPEARDWARAQGLKNGNDWQALCRSGARPSDIPVDRAKSTGIWAGNHGVIG
jgi:hypothetical protein